MSYGLKKLIVKKYAPPEWAVVLELRDGVGWSAGSHAGYGGAIDAAAFNCWPSKGWHRLAFECKEHRSDFFRELEKPEKRRWVEEHFHQTWFVTAPGVCKVDEVPEGWGLLVATKDRTKLIRRKAAMHRETGELPEGLALSAIRSLATAIHGADTRHYYFEGMWVQQHQLDEVVEDECVELRTKLIEKTTDIARAERKLIDERVLLRAPLAELANQMGGWHPRQEVGSGKKTPTTEEVREWFLTAGANALRKATKDIVNAKHSLDTMLRNLDVDPESMAKD